MKYRTGGQTGVDRAVLDVCLAHGLGVGGWCPEGRTAEDGRIPERYPLKELLGGDYSDRTRANVRDSDGTLILRFGEMEGGTKLTFDYCAEVGKPCLSLDLDDVDLDQALESIRRFVSESSIRELNVGGPRLSEAAESYAKTKALLEELVSANV